MPKDMSKFASKVSSAAVKDEAAHAAKFPKKAKSAPGVRVPSLREAKFVKPIPIKIGPPAEKKK